MLEDPARDERVGEGGDAVAAAAARGAAQHVDREGPLEELGPGLALCFGAGVGFGLGLADAWRATVAAMALMSVAGEMAAERAIDANQGVGSMAVYLLDTLQRITDADFADRLKLTVLS